MTSFTYSEYHDVIRVDSDTMTPRTGYKFFAADGNPLSSLLYAREMTLARGRILYEVWDSWRETFTGYIVPSLVYSEALAFHDGPTAAWSRFRPDRRLIYHQTYRLITERFPRIHLMTARAVTEIGLFEYDRLRVPPWVFIEPIVVEQVKSGWTSYDFRLSELHQTPPEAFKSVKKRMRDVLESWLPAATPWNTLIDFWERHDLLDEDEIGKEKELVRMHPYGYTLRWHGGAETNANLMRATPLPML
ncbi:hypothetical protein PRZ48_005473 [Zasmidium cellare]|uniref:Uncharacterized protein n=1 Tax=Zasmidium cellare TaxID=395010 RepID=A0ABR0ESH9_ZASCE|nr:hypothetical protein PRZ48_005473 [Zasmidium cellare]